MTNIAPWNRQKVGQHYDLGHAASTGFGLNSYGPSRPGNTGHESKHQYLTTKLVDAQAAANQAAIKAAYAKVRPAEALAAAALIKASLKR